MDYSESTKLVFQRIQKLDAENASKIMGYLLIKDHGELEMIRLACGPDYVIQMLIERIKKELGLPPDPSPSVPASTSQVSSPVSKLPTKFTPYVPISTRPPPPTPPPLTSGQWIPQMVPVQYFPVAFINPAAGAFVSPIQPLFLPFEDQFGSLNLVGPIVPAQGYNYSYTYVPNPRVPNVPPPCPSMPELDLQICDNFRKGYRKYGGDCKYFHVIQTESGYCLVLNPPDKDEKARCNHNLPHGSLKQLETEFIDLLKSRTGIPVTIYALPILYFDKFGKTLELEPYIADACRRKKFNGGVVEFLAQMSNCFGVIDRPYGMQSIILEDDIPMYLEFAEEQTVQNPTVACSHQVYLTFPPHSMFGDQDLHDYFNHFGPVQDIRVPIQEKRMYGFVTFVYPESASLVLSKSNPHFICGAQVLVKPYQLRPPAFLNRKTEENAECPTYLKSFLPHEHFHHHLASQPSETMTILTKELIKEKEPQIDYKMKSTVSTMEDIGTSSRHNHNLTGQASGSSAFIEAVLSGCSTSKANFNTVNTPDNATHQSFDGLNLPDNPFLF